MGLISRVSSRTYSFTSNEKSSSFINSKKVQNIQVNISTKNLQPIPSNLYAQTFNMSIWHTSNHFTALDTTLISSTRDTDLTMLLDLFQQYKVENFAHLFEKVQSTLEIYQ